MKKLFILMSAVIMMTGVASYAQTFNDGDYSYKIIDRQKKTVKFTGGAFDEWNIMQSPLVGDVVVPEKVQGYTVVSIGSLDYSTQMTSIVVPTTIEEMDMHTFAHCISLTNVEIKEGIQTLPIYVFEGCTSLETIILPESVTSIGDFAFKECTSLQNVFLPSGLTSLGWGAFQACTSLKSIVLPEKLKEIAGVFNGCTSLEDVAFPAELVSIGVASFSGCTSLKSLSIPSTVRFIGDYAFQFSGLESFIIPSTVTSMGNQLLTGCENLKDLYVLVTDSLKSSILSDGCANLEYLYINSRHIASPVYAGLHWYNLEQYGITETGFPKLKTIEFGPDVKSITHGMGMSAVSDSLNVIINSNITTKDENEGLNYSIGIAASSVCFNCDTVVDNLFWRIKDLKKVCFTDKVKVIKSYAFSGTGLTSVTLPSSIMIIQDGAFSDMQNLEKVYSHIKEPIYIHSSVFQANWESDGFTSATLYVPQGTINTYKETWAWSLFKYISEFEPSAIYDIATKDNGKNDAYNISGQRLAAPRKGVNIVDGKKVVVR